jgi:hypothetical protein
MGKCYPEEAATVRQWLGKGAEYMFIPSGKLKTMVSQEEHPFIKSMPDSFKYVILTGSPICVDEEMVLEYYEGRLDYKNTFVFDHGDIRITPQRL